MEVLHGRSKGSPGLTSLHEEIDDGAQADAVEFPAAKLDPTTAPSPRRGVVLQERHQPRHVPSPGQDGPLLLGIGVSKAHPFRQVAKAPFLEAKESLGEVGVTPEPVLDACAVNKLRQEGGLIPCPQLSLAVLDSRLLLPSRVPSRPMKGIARPLEIERQAAVSTIRQPLQKLLVPSVGIDQIAIARERVGSEGDTLPPKRHIPLQGGESDDMAVTTEEVAAAKAMYYGMAGWDKDGHPTRAKLEELAVGWVGDELDLQ